MYFIIQQMVLGIHFHHNDERKILKHNFVCPSTTDINNSTAHYVFCIQFFLIHEYCWWHKYTSSSDYMACLEHK